MAGLAQRSPMLLAVARSLRGARPALCHPTPPGAASRSGYHTSCPALHYCSRALAKEKQRCASKQKEFKDPGYVYGQRRNIKLSPWKLNLVARQVRGMQVDEAIKLLEISKKKAASPVQQVLKITKSNASLHHGVEDQSSLYVHESYVGKGMYIPGSMRVKGRGRGTRSEHAKAHYYLKLKVGPTPSKKPTGIERPSFHSRKLIQQLERRPPTVRNSM